MADNLLRLKVDSQEYDDKIKRAAEGIQRFAEQVYKSGGAVTELEKDEVAFIKALGNMETVSKSATGKLREMESAYKNLSATYHMLQKDQQNDAGGKALRASLDQLKVRIDETRTAIKKADAELNDFSQTEKKFSKESFDLNGILSQVGGQMGINTSLVSGLTTGTLGLGAAITAVTAAEYKAAEAFKAYNDELARQSQITGVTTGLKGADADSMTAAARSISKVYGTDFREVINAANTLMTQFGTDGEFALNTIRDGMQGMIQGDGPKLLQMIQQYAPAFRDAGISASQLVAIIQNSEGGIFSAENMNAIVMGIKNLRLMTKATSDALAEIGINGEKMTRQLNEGTISIFDALRQVSDALQSTESGSQQAGQVMQQVFGRQGTAAGTNLAKAIATLNTNLEETKRQTGEVGESFAELEKKTEELDKAIMNLLKVDNWDVLTNTIETGVVEGLTKCVNLLNDALDVVNNIGKAFGGPVVQGVVDFLVALSGPVGLIYEAYNLLKGGSGNTPKAETQEEKAQRMSSSFIGNINSSQDKTGTYNRNIALLNKTLEKYKAEGNKEKADLTQRVIEIVEEHMDKTFAGFGGTGKKFKPTVKEKNKNKKEETDDFEEIIGLTNSAQERVNSLQKQIRESWDEGEIDELNKKLIKAQAELTRLQNIGKQKDWIKGTSGFNQQTMNAWMQGRQSDLSKAEYGTSDYQNIKANIADMNTIKTVLEQSMKAGIDAAQFNLEPLWEKVFDGENIPDDTWKKIIDVINKKLKEAGLDTINIDFTTGNLKDGKKSKSGKNDIQKLMSGSSSILSGIQSMGVELPKELQETVSVIQGLISVIEGVNTVISIFATSAIAANTAAVAANTTALAINTAVPSIFARGGVVHAAGGYVVPGHQYSGDLVPAALSSGEMVLNKQQQMILAGTLENGGMKNISISGHLEGETIALSVDRWGKRSGRGELAFWKNQ